MTLEHDSKSEENCNLRSAKAGHSSKGIKAISKDVWIGDLAHTQGRICLICLPSCGAVSQCSASGTRYGSVQLVVSDACCCSAVCMARIHIQPSYLYRLQLCWKCYCWAVLCEQIVLIVLRSSNGCGRP